MTEPSWHEDDEFWAAVETVLFTEERLAGTCDDVSQALALMGPLAGNRMLDLGCGPGRASIELARRGHRVTGVDRTLVYLDHARERAERAGVELELVHEDMRRFFRPNAFDAAFSLFTTFGYFDDERDEQTVLENVARSLAPGGKLLMELAGKEIIARTFQARGFIEGPGSALLEERRIRPGFAWVDSRWVVWSAAGRREFSISIRLYSAEELSGLLQAAGFARVTTYGSLAGAPYDNEARRLVLVAEKH